MGDSVSDGRDVSTTSPGVALQRAGRSSRPAAPPADGPDALPDDVRDALRDPRNLFGDHVLVQVVGMGGSGVVYRAWQRSLRRYVALKLLHDREDGHGGDVDREAQIAARLAHPHIVPVHEVGSHDGRRYMTMRLIGGVPMTRVRLDPRRATSLVRDAAEAVEHAHRAGIVHRDLKPQNLLLEDDGHLWVTDFGLARRKEGGSTLSAGGALIGTPAYMPPEQARGQRCDERSDVYALGATLYHLLAGRPPFEGETAIAVLVEQLRGEPTPPRRLNPAVHPEVEIIVAKAMSKDPARRYASARELADDLQRHLEGRPILARPPGLPRRALKWCRRHPLTSGGLAALAIMAVIVAVYLVNIQQARRRAELQVAETMVAEANALGAAGRWEQARARYLQASSEFRRLGARSAATDFGLLDAHHHAPGPLLTLLGHAGSVRAVAFLPDGKRALSAGDDATMRLWDLPIGREIRSFRGHSEAINGIALSADGRLALSGSHDQTMRLWELATGNVLRTIAVRGGPAQKVALSPDGRMALSRTEQGVVQLWDVGTGLELRTFNVVQNRVLPVAFSPDGRLALTGVEILPGSDRDTVSRASVWDVHTGRELHSLGTFNAEIETLAFSPDGRRVLSAGFEQIVSVWDVPSGRELLSLKGHLHGLKGAAFSPRDRVIVSGGEDNSIKLWDAGSGQLVRTLDAEHGVEALTVSPDGGFILSGGDDGSLKLWDVSVGQEVRTFSGHEGRLTAVAFSPDSRLALTGGMDRKLRLWDVASGQEIRSMPASALAFSLAFTPDGRLALAGSSDREIAVWDVRLARKLRSLVGHSGHVRTVAISPDGRWVLSGSLGGEVKLWELATGREVRSWRNGSEVRSAVFSPDGRLALSGGADGTALLVDLSTGRVVRSLAVSPPERLSAVAFSPDGRLALTGSMSKTVRLWEVSSGRQLGILSGHLGDIRALRFSPDGHVVLSASRDRTMRVWDLATTRELHAFAWASDRTWSFDVSPDGRFALEGHEDGSLSHWDFSYVDGYRAFEGRLPAALSALHGSPEDARGLATLGEWYAFRGATGWAIALLDRAARAGARVSPLMLGRCHWQEGDLPAARREFRRALAQGEAPAEYLTLLIDAVGQSDQAGPLSERSLRDGRVRYPFLGVRTATATEDARGARVTQLFPGGPAAAAGLRIDDLIVAVDEQRLDNEAALGSYLASRAAGSLVAVTYLRDGQSHSVQMTLGQRPARLWQADGPPLREPRLGCALQTLTPVLARSLGLDPATHGAVVSDAVTSNQPPEIVGALAREDVLVSVAGRPVTTAEEAVAAIEALPRWSLPATVASLQLIRPGIPR